MAPRFDLPFDILVSYHYVRRDTDMLALTAGDVFRVIGDSGAFSAFTQGDPVDIGAYAEWVRRWRPRLFWAASLDVFGDPEASFANWRTLRDRYQVDTVPTVHIGTDMKWLDVYAGEGVDFVGLGGMVGIDPVRQTRFLVHAMRYARERHPTMRFHAWGTTKQAILAKLPIYSADSSGLMAQAFRYAQLQLWNAERRDTFQFYFDARDPVRHRQLLRRQYGINHQDIMRSTPANRTLIAGLCAQSTTQRARWLQQRHTVPAPAWALNGAGPVGPRLHIAETNPRDFLRLAEAVAGRNNVKDVP